MQSAHPNLFAFLESTSVENNGRKRADVMRLNRDGHPSYQEMKQHRKWQTHWNVHWWQRCLHTRLWTARFSSIASRARPLTSMKLLVSRDERSALVPCGHGCFCAWCVSDRSTGIRECPTAGHMRTWFFVCFEGLLSNFMTSSTLLLPSKCYIAKLISTVGPIS